MTKIQNLRVQTYLTCLLINIINNPKTIFIMRIKHLLVLMAATFTAVSTYAQEEEDKNIFNHLSVGVTAGTPGIGGDVAMPICNYVQVRAGFAMMPKFKFSTDLELNDVPNVADAYIPDLVDVEAKIGFANGKLLFDIYPFKKSAFHITAGAYFGGGSIIKAYNKEDGLLKDVADYNRRNPDDLIGYELGDYLLTPDANGNVNAEIKTSGFRPYIGIGNGRAVPKKRIGFMFEVGVMFWGTPKIYCNGDELTNEDLGSDSGDVVEVLSKLKIYPVINFRLCGRIF